MFRRFTRRESVLILVVLGLVAIVSHDYLLARPNPAPRSNAQQATTSTFLPLVLTSCPSIPPASGRIAFVSYRDSSSEIYTMHADGSGLARLTNNTNSESAPTWSPSGQQIAYARYEGIYAMRPDGSQQTRLTTSSSYASDPAWSPDGQRIAFAISGNLFLMNADGSQPTLFEGSSNYLEDFTWSPDGQRIALRSSYATSSGGISVITIADKKIVDISYDRSATDPAWSPDGQYIAFTSTRDGSNDIYIMKPDGSQQTLLTNSPQANDSEPTWSPDSKRIAFVSDRDGNDEIYVMNANGTGQTRITNDPASDSQPSWSPN